MSYNIVLTARKGIGWVGERGDDVGVLAEEKHRKVKPNRVAPGVVRSRDDLKQRAGPGGKRLGTAEGENPRNTSQLNAHTSHIQTIIQTISDIKHSYSPPTRLWPNHPMNFARRHGAAPYLSAGVIHR